jgi:hypothetical protein
MMRRGALADVRPSRRRGVDVGQLAELLADRPLACAVLQAIVDGRLRVRALTRDEKPPSLIESWDAIS